MPTVAKEGYTRLQIALHWIVAFLVIFQLVFGESMTETIDAAEEGGAASAADLFLAGAHYWVGIAILLLAGLRLYARLQFGAPAHAGRGHPVAVRAAALVHALFYLLLFAMPVLGLLAYYFGDPWGPIHTLGKPALVVLIAVHSLAALFNQFVLRDGTLVRMFVPAEHR